MSKSLVTIKRGQAILTSVVVNKALVREQIELAKLLAEESKLDFLQALSMIENICGVILPGYRGVAKLDVFRTVIRNRLKDEFIGFEESQDHSATISDARHAGCP